MELKPLVLINMLTREGLTSYEMPKMCTLSWFKEHNPFDKSPELSSLSRGVMASDMIEYDRTIDKDG